MGFSENIKQFSERVTTLKQTISTEEATKMSLIVPFFQLLGYDVFNPTEFCPEFTADVGVKKGEKVDYAILLNGTPEILIECKWCGDTLEKHGSQLFRYFTTSSAKFAILTNGLKYMFFTDLEEANKMDLSPFMTIDLENLKDTSINELKKFSKEAFDKDSIFSSASDLKYTGLIKEWLKQQSEEITDDFAKAVLSSVYDGLKTQKVIDKFKPIIKKSFNSYINDIVNQKITSALSPEVDETPDAENEEILASKIVTTEEELQAYNIVLAILSEKIDISEISYRDTESYFGILYHDNNRKPICRLNLDTKKKQILIPDSSKNFTRTYINNITDIFKLKKDLLKVLDYYI